MTPPVGRPKAENPKSERIYIRVTPEEKKEIQDYSHKTGLSILELIKRGIAATKNKK